MMRPVPPAAGQLYDTLIASSTDHRRVKSLERLWAALLHLWSGGSQDFSQANVARAITALARERGESRVSPSYSTIRGDKTKAFSALVAAFANGVQNKSADDDESEFVAREQDPARRAYLRVLVADNQALRRRNEMLKEMLTRCEPIEISKLADPVRREVGIIFTAIEQQSVNAFLADVESSLPVVIDHPSGAILHRGESGHEIAGPGFIHALKRIVAEAF